ncbi:eukaryotic aspartyl protease-domain-containing protein [Chlamydoabsidia padenii]|nr:eukaryotic aspartyl protease-domain-containing protein [Chlamydoabsidia padenii]
MQEKFSIQYGIGSVNGTYVQDTVMVSGAKVSQQQFGLATHTKDILIPQDSSSSSSPGGTLDANGILGLGYPQLTAATTQNNPAYTPFVFNLVQQGLIQEPIFSVYMNSASQLGWSGEIIFGGVDTSKFEGDLVYLPVAKLQSHPSPSPEGEGNGQGGYGGDEGGDDNDDDNDDDSNMDGAFVEKHHLRTIDLEHLDIKIDQYLHKSDTNNTTTSDYQGYYYWMVYGQGIAVRNSRSNDRQQNPQFKLQKPGAFILDTGTTLTYLPNDVAISIATAMAGSNGFQLDRQSGLLVVDCSTATSTATLELQMSTSPSLTSPPVTFAVKASELVIPLDGKTAATARTCLFGIAPVGGSGGGLGSNMFLIGDSMLRSSYLVFDMGKNVVGIAPAKGMGATVNGKGTSSSSFDGNGGGSTSSASSSSSRHGPLFGSLWFGQLYGPLFIALFISFNSLY